MGEEELLPPIHSGEIWLNLQIRYDLEVEKGRLKGRLEQEVKVLASAT